MILQCGQENSVLLNERVKDLSKASYSATLADPLKNREEFSSFEDILEKTII